MATPAVFQPEAIPVQGLIPEPALSLYKTWGARRGIDWRLVAAIGKVESDHNPAAQNPADPSVGLMGTQPLIIWTFGLERERSIFTGQSAIGRNNLLNQVLANPALGVKAGTGFLRELMDKWRGFSLNDILQMYNLGETAFFNGARNPAYLFTINGGGAIGWFERYQQEF